MIFEITEGGTSPYQSGTSEAQSPQEAALAVLLLGASLTGTAALFDASRDSLCEFGGAADDPALFRLFDRACSSIWVPEPVRARHPLRIVDPVTGRPAYMFGAGGSGANALTQIANGCVVQKAIADAKGAESNVKPIWTRGTGWTAFWKVLVPAPNSTSHGVTWPAATGGAVFGNQIGTDAQVGYVGISSGSGVIVATPADNGQGVSGPTDLRTAAVHTAIVSYDAQAGVGRIWRNGAANPEGGLSNMADIADTAGAARLALGAALGTNGTPANRFAGLIYAAGFVNAPLGMSQTNRDIITAYLATR